MESPAAAAAAYFIDHLDEHLPNQWYMSGSPYLWEVHSNLDIILQTRDTLYRRGQTNLTATDAT